MFRLHVNVCWTLKTEVVSIQCMASLCRKLELKENKIIETKRKRDLCLSYSKAIGYVIVGSYE